MSAIKNALARLDHAVGRLDGVIGGVEKNLKGQQRDMFTSPSNQNSGDANAGTIDGAVIAKRLDQAIQKVETILKDGTKG